MEVLLVSGSPNTGKSSVLLEVGKFLRTNNFIDVNAPVKTTLRNDEATILRGMDINGKSIQIFLNTASDTFLIIDMAKQVLSTNPSVDFIISSVRDMGVERDCLINEICPNVSFLEVPLAKVSRKGNRVMAINDYQNRIVNLIKHIMHENPFNIV